MQSIEPQVREPKNAKGRLGGRVIPVELVREAAPLILSDLRRRNPSMIRIQANRLSEGSAKDAVLHLELGLPAVLVVDSTHNLPRELEKRCRLPECVKDSIPALYMSKSINSGLTVAVMEYTGKSVTQLIREGETQAVQLIDEALERWSRLYIETREEGSMNLKALYVNWMLRRTRDAAARDSKIRHIVDEGLMCNGEFRPPLARCIARIRPLLEKLQPGFTTFLHGDMWPSNWTVHPITGKLYLIDWDPYHRPVGDYLYDQAKIGWYLRTTTDGFDAIPSDPFAKKKISPLRVDLRRGSQLWGISYSLKQPAWVRDALGLHSSNMQALASSLDDPSWRARYELALGATFVGLTRKAILRYGDSACAAVLYAMGADHLERCVDLASAGGKDE